MGRRTHGRRSINWFKNTTSEDRPEMKSLLIKNFRKFHNNL